MFMFLDLNSVLYLGLVHLRTHLVEISLFRFLLSSLPLFLFYIQFFHTWVFYHLVSEPGLPPPWLKQDLPPPLTLKPYLMLLWNLF